LHSIQKNELNVLLGHIFEHHVCARLASDVYHVLPSKDKLTDKVIETQEGPTELCSRCQSDIAPYHHIALMISAPLSPFITTHILDPTHLSINSSGNNCVAILLAVLLARTQRGLLVNSKR